MKPIAAARSRSRQFLVQALYQAQLTDTEFALVIDPFVKDHNMKRADIDYFKDVLRGIANDQQNLEELIAAKADRPFEELDPVEKGILMMGAYELSSRIDVPYRVVINEGIELAKSFGATDSYKYVNSILDALAKELRQAE
ncbi:MAG: transcription antitermination factor NusB [Proteobacteria bacterium]|nr:transcription antitermination factor NusB [Pseudomonadota bacterium]